MVRGDFTIREGIVKWIKLRREQSKVWALYLYLSFRVVNDIGGSVRRLKARFAPDVGDQVTLTTAPGVSVAVLCGQAGAGGQELLVAGGALHLAGVPVSLTPQHPRGLGLVLLHVSHSRREVACRGAAACRLPPSVVKHHRAEQEEHEGQGAQQHHQPCRALNLRGYKNEDKTSLTRYCNCCQSYSLRYYLGQIGLNRDGQTVRQREVDWGGELTSAQR